MSNKTFKEDIMVDAKIGSLKKNLTVV